MGKITLRRDEPLWNGGDGTSTVRSGDGRCGAQRLDGERILQTKRIEPKCEVHPEIIP